MGIGICQGCGEYMGHSEDCALYSNRVDDNTLVDELAMTIRRFVHKCRKAGIEAEFCDLTMDYLKRKGLQGSPLR